MVQADALLTSQRRAQQPLLVPPELTLVTYAQGKLMTKMDGVFALVDFEYTESTLDRRRMMAVLRKEWVDELRVDGSLDKAEVPHCTRTRSPWPASPNTGAPD